ncbi:MAG: UvrB/UvrC motif-containing protein [Candidatus Omnitrophica bacterium]|nr:UvrB/UvrC motif-containing protein [Candidatus Omnitrophota bacterium]
MQCDICAKKKATVHLTEIVDQQMSEMHLCEECARQKSVQMEQQFGLADLLAGLADMGGKTAVSKETGAAAKTAALTCTKCGLSYDDFRKFGRLGCGHCYISFKEQLDALLKKIHGSNHHLGKMVAKSKKTVSSAAAKGKKDDLTSLRQDLQEAIHSEDFEKAAQIRDKIRDMEKKEK